MFIFPSAKSVKNDSISTVNCLCICFRFIVFQFFLTPTVSSFCRPDEKGNYKHYVIEPAITGAVAVINCLFTPMLFTIMCLLRYRWTSLGFEHLVIIILWIISDTVHLCELGNEIPTPNNKALSSKGPPNCLRKTQLLSNPIKLPQWRIVMMLKYGNKTSSSKGKYLSSFRLNVYSCFAPASFYHPF